MTTSRVLSYGLLGLPLAFAALPIYVHVPRFYADIAGMELAVLGTILLGARLLDAGIDPWLGWLADRLPRRAMLAVALLPSPWVSSPCSIRRQRGRACGCSVRWR